MVIFWQNSDLQREKLHNRTDDNTHVFAPTPKVYILLRVSDMIFILKAQPTEQSTKRKQGTK